MKTKLKFLLIILIFTNLRLLSSDVILVEVEEKMVGEKVHQNNELWSFHFSETNCTLSAIYSDKSGLTQNLFSGLFYFDYTFDVKKSLVRLKNEKYSIDIVTEPIIISPSRSVARSLNLATIKELNGIFSNESIISGKLITRTYRLKSPEFKLKL
jgi:hypothetical protein